MTDQALPHLRTLDAAASAPLLPEARDAMVAALDEAVRADAANPSSVHSPGHRARQLVEEARDRIAAALGARSAEVIFTSGGTEANNLAVLGLSLAAVRDGDAHAGGPARAVGAARARHVVTTAIEHPSVLESSRALGRMHGFEVTELPVDGDGRVDPEAFERAVRPDTALVSIGLANAEVGTVQDLLGFAEHMAELATHAAGGRPRFHTDAVQAAATLPVSFASGCWPGLAVDAMTIAAHKFGGPQGVGALLLRQGNPIEPILHGGGQELGARSGTENVAAIAGFAAAVECTVRGIGTRAAALATSRDTLVSRVLADVPGARLTGHPTERLPGHASFVVEGVSGESLLVALDAAGIAASSGSACAAGSDEPSPVLLALGIEPTLAQTAVRFTLAGPLNNEAGQALVHRVVEVLRREVHGAHLKRRP